MRERTLYDVYLDATKHYVCGVHVFISDFWTESVCEIYHDVIRPKEYIRTLRWRWWTIVSLGWQKTSRSWLFILSRPAATDRIAGCRVLGCGGWINKILFVHKIENCNFFFHSINSSDIKLQQEPIANQMHEHRNRFTIWILFLSWSHIYVIQFIKCDLLNQPFILSNFLLINSYLSSISTIHIIT